MGHYELVRKAKFYAITEQEKFEQMFGQKFFPKDVTLTYRFAHLGCIMKRKQRKTES